MILPTYNERENIAKLIELLGEHLKGYDYEVIVVDDNSPDGTAEVAKALSSKYPVKVVVRPKRMGLTSAIYCGVRIATGNIIVVMDADLQHPPSLVPKLISRARECDVIVASRYVKGGNIEKWSLTRKIVSLGAVLVTKMLIPECRGVKDPVSGFFAVHRELLANWRPIVPEGYKALVEILGSIKPKRVCEEPYMFRARSTGRSKLSSRIMFSYVKLLFKLCPGLTLLLITIFVTSVVAISILLVQLYL